MKHFLGESRISPGKEGNQRGMNNYEIARDLDGRIVFLLRGTFSVGELRAMVDAIELENDSFQFPNTSK